jgi:hypothetical protein
LDTHSFFFQRVVEAFEKVREKILNAEKNEITGQWIVMAQNIDRWVFYTSFWLGPKNEWQKHSFHMHYPIIFIGTTEIVTTTLFFGIIIFDSFNQ